MNLLNPVLPGTPSAVHRGFFQAGSHGAAPELAEQTVAESRVLPLRVLEDGAAAVVLAAPALRRAGRPVAPVRELAILFCFQPARYWSEH